jgi:hypothetical protein
MLAAEVRRVHQLEREMLISKARIATLSAEIATMGDFADYAERRKEPGQSLRLIHTQSPARPYVEQGAASLADENRERGRGQTFAFSPTFTRLQSETDTEVLPIVNSKDV